MAVQLQTETFDVKAGAVPVRLVLNRRDDGIIDLEAHLSNGMEWVLMKFKEDGTFYRYPDNTKETGFKLTADGKIVESKTEY